MHDLVDKLNILAAQKQGAEAPPSAAGVTTPAPSVAAERPAGGA